MKNINNKGVRKALGNMVLIRMKNDGRPSTRVALHLTKDGEFTHTTKRRLKELRRRKVVPLVRHIHSRYYGCMCYIAMQGNEIKWIPTSGGYEGQVMEPGHINPDYIDHEVELP